MPRLRCPATLTVLVVLLAAPVIADDGTWIPLPPPAGRWDAGAIYDPVGDRLVVVGGILPGGYGNDVWVRTPAPGSEWEFLPIGTPPVARRGHTIIYDAVRSRLILFGGQSYDEDSGTAVYLNDLWVATLSGTPIWTQVSPTGTPPPPRSQHVAIYDAARDRMIIFGGTNATSSELGDTWALSLAGTPAWQEFNVNGTPSRKNASAIYDPIGARMLVFGGSAGSTLLNDVQQFTLTHPYKWSVIPASGAPPDPREGHTAVYDPVANRMIVYGGTRPYLDLLGDVWALSLSGTPNWAAFSPPGSPPSPRYQHSAVWDTARNRMVLFGGYGGSGDDDDVWTLDVAGAGWNELPAPLTPGSRGGSASFYDPVRDRLLVFGGTAPAGNGGQYFNDVWVRSRSASSVWTQLVPSGTPPPARSGAIFVYDPSRDRAVLFGGSGQNTVFNDVWVLNLAQGAEWAELTPIGTLPTARFRSCGIYDAERDRMVIFGGGYFGSNDTWELVFTDPPAWNELHPTGLLPEHRLGASAVLDAARDRMIVFGGGHGPEPETFFNDVWELSLGESPAWNLITPTGTPPDGRTDHTAFFDALRDRMVIHAGGNLIGFYPATFSDTWELSFAGAPAWNELHPAGPVPSRRGLHAWGYDAVHDVLLLFGGYTSGEYTNDTWMLRWNSTTGVIDNPLASRLTLIASPNPALLRTTFHFVLPKEATVTLSIHDLAGHRVATVLDHRVLPAGTQRISWDAGRVLPSSGIYFYRCHTDWGDAMGRLVFLQ